jgi:hypothetical protein
MQNLNHTFLNQRLRAITGSCIVAVAGLVFLAISATPASTDTGRLVRPDLLKVGPSYRSNQGRHKVTVCSGEQQLYRNLLDQGAKLIEDYGSFALLSVPEALLQGAGTRAWSGFAIRDDSDLILLRAGAFDTQDDTDSKTGAPDLPASSAPESLYLVQMHGPIKPEWLQWLRRTSNPVTYIPNNAYLVRVSSESLSGLKTAAVGGPDFVQWVGPYKPSYKISPGIRLDSTGYTPVTVQLINTSSLDRDLAAIDAQSESMIGSPESVLNYVDVTVSASPEQIAQLARMSNVLWIEPALETRMFDERQDQIIAGNYSGKQLAPPGYLSWLRSRGLASPADFIIDLADSGIDKGSVDPNVLHKAFLSPAGLSRIAYARFVGSDGQTGAVDDTTGHGTLNASIIAGYNQPTSAADLDSDGYGLGLGVAPFATLGITKVFNPDFTKPDYVSMVSSAYGLGARVSSNSWGQDGNSYTTSSQIYDALVRDANPATPGNQEMTVLFAVGNQGPLGHIASPANAKNVIAVGASQNLRPTGTDGCNITPAGASDAESIIGFSSGGPVDDGRIKPDLVAPGTHIQGALSQDPANAAQGICGPKDYPTGQSLYTWSSGTSHSTPAVAGVAALARQYIQQYTGKTPSPAMIKAFLINSTSYLAGAGAGDNLPGRNQGWGGVNLGTALDGEPRILVDQTHLMTSTGQEFTLRGKIVDPNRQLRVTLVWTDAPGSPAGSPIMNDLDLRVDFEGASYFGNNFDGHSSVIGGPADKLNNAESVWLPEGSSGDFTIHVVAANLVADGVPGNDTAIDQDFALVVCNGQSEDPLVDSPPVVSLTYPIGGEHISGGSVLPIAWSAGDDKGIVSQKVEASIDGGISYNAIASLDGTASSFSWLVTDIHASHARVKVTSYDGVNLPVSAESANFEIDPGPPDSTPPSVVVVSPSGGSLIAGGSAFTVTWMEADNVGVVKRAGALSTDGGRSFNDIFNIVAPSTGAQQSYSWQVPAALSTDQGALRMTVWDGAGNSAAATSGPFQVWGLPVINSVSFNPDGGPRGELIINGKNFRKDETQVLVNGASLKRLSFQNPDGTSGAFSEIVSADPKIRKRIPAGQTVEIVVTNARTGQTSAAFEFTRE